MKLVQVGKTIRCDEVPPEREECGATILIVDKINWLQEDPREPPGVIVHFDNGEKTRVFESIETLTEKIELCHKVVLEKDEDLNLSNMPV